MGFEAEDPSSSPVSTPKLSLFSLPNQVTEPPGMLTPPLHTPASVPFLWEEAPGKPLFSNYGSTNSFKPTSLARCLELPPRLVTPEVKNTDLPVPFSPSTVLEGPYVRRSVSAREGFRSLQDIGSLSKRREESSGYFGGGSWRKKNSKRNTRVCEDSCVISPPSSASSTVGDTEGHAKVKITRIKRTSSFFSMSNSKSHHNHTHLWASIYGTFKQVVPLPWRSRKIKKNGHSF